MAIALDRNSATVHRAGRRAACRRPDAATLSAAAWCLLVAGTAVYRDVAGAAAVPAGGRPGGGAPLSIPELVALAVCLAGAVLAVRIGRPPYRRWHFAVAAAAAALLLWQAGLNYLFLGVQALLGEPITATQRHHALLNEPFWLLGGVLWTVAVLSSRRHAEPAGEVSVQLAP
jgi:hypothetical protein